MWQKWDGPVGSWGRMRARRRSALAERRGMFGDLGEGLRSSKAGGAREYAGLIQVRSREQVREAEGDDKREGNEEMMHRQLQRED